MCSFVPFCLKIAFVRRFSHFGIHITIAFSFFNPRVLIFVFLSFFISFTAKIAGEIQLRHFVRRSQKVCMLCYSIKSVKHEAGNHANFCGISNLWSCFTAFSCHFCDIFRQTFCLAGKAFNCHLTLISHCKKQVFFTNNLCLSQ